MFTYNKLILLLQRLAEQHNQINSFGVGDYHEIGSGKLLYGPMPQQDGESRSPVYPLMWMLPTPVSVHDHYTVYTFTLALFDLVDKAEVIENEVLSDTLQIIHDLMVMLRYEADKSRKFSFLNTNIDVRPTTDEFDDELTGWFCDVSIKVPVGYCNAAVPANLTSRS